MDFRNTIVVMTSNIGSDLIRQDRSIGFSARSEGAQDEKEKYDRMKDNVLDEVKRFFRPEFLNPYRRIGRLPLSESRAYEPDRRV